MSGNTLPQPIHSESEAQLANVGYKYTADDGRQYTYVQAGSTALVAGSLYQGDPRAPDTANALDAPAMGETAITAAATASTADNQWRDGYIATGSASTTGGFYKIDRSVDSGTDTVVHLSRSQPLFETVAAADTGTVIASPYRNVTLTPVSSTGPTAKVVGVGVFPVSATQYGWVQNRGPAKVRIANPAAVVALGGPLWPSIVTAGECITDLALFTVASMTDANPAVVTTTGSHDVIIGDTVRFASVDQTLINQLHYVSAVGSVTAFTILFDGSGGITDDAGTAALIWSVRPMIGTILAINASVDIAIADLNIS